jgi:hypothetical protein
MQRCFMLCREPGSEQKPAEQGQPLMPAEEVVSRSGLGAQVITSFLFEHYVHMIAPEAIEDAAASAEKFSDAVFMLGRGSHDTGTFGAPFPTILNNSCCIVYACVQLCLDVCVQILHRQFNPLDIEDPSSDCHVTPKSAVFATLRGAHWSLKPRTIGRHHITFAFYPLQVHIG